SVHKEADSVHKTDAHPSLTKHSQRLPPEEMKRRILELCQDRWLSKSQLAEVLDRHPDGLRSRFLTPMVESGLLRLRYPDKPNHTDQTYTSTEMTSQKQ
ncbi:MAG: transcriptional regulator, partial [Magnetococcales bacterium]|nr:transcriptional regulator [Magnetococcales bacterium]